MMLLRSCADAGRALSSDIKCLYFATPPPAMRIGGAAIVSNLSALWQSHKLARFGMSIQGSLRMSNRCLELFLIAIAGFANISCTSPADLDVCRA